jgi:putative SOS response-associated peptidase YedK
MRQISTLRIVTTDDQNGNMCGRFAMDKTTNELIEEFVITTGRNPNEWAPSFNVAPTMNVPVVRMQGDQRELQLVRWGIVPPSSPTFGGGRPVINARIETVATNGLFKGAFASHRCIVPATGYYEWAIQETGKQPFFIHSGDHDLALAGIIRAWADKSKDKDDPDYWRPSMAIITRDASTVHGFGEVHDRQPAMLTPDSYDDWLGEGLDSEELLKMLEHTTRLVADDIDFYPVSKAVGSPKNDSPALLEPITL